MFWNRLNLANSTLKINEKVTKRPSRVKLWVYQVLEDPSGGGISAVVVSVLMLLLIVVNVLGVTVSELDNYGDENRSYPIFALLMTIVFLLEYIARIWIADLVYPTRSRLGSRFKYVLSIMGVIDFLAFTPSIIAFFYPEFLFFHSADSFVRLIRLMKIARYMAGMLVISRVLKRQSREIFASFMVIFFLMFVASVLMCYFEFQAQPKNFDSVFNGMYWAMTTITTTGYGDLYPITDMGKLLDIVIMSLSIGVVAIPGGIVSAGFVAEYERSKHQLHPKVSSIKWNSNERKYGHRTFGAFGEKGGNMSLKVNNKKLNSAESVDGPRRISDIYKNKDFVLSFEIFPPKGELCVENAHKLAGSLANLKPDFISVTYSAAGSGNSQSTQDIASDIQKDFGISALSHLACVNLPHQNLKDQIARYKAHGVENILALRGDGAKGGAKGEFKHASDLLEYLQKYDFCLGAAAYPEAHIENTCQEQNIAHLKTKQDAGAQFLITQLFFDNEYFYRFWDRALDKDINIPISCGIMPLLSKSQIERMVYMCGVTLPAALAKLIHEYEHCPHSMRSAGIEYACKQMVDLKDQGVSGVHVYTMNSYDIANAAHQSIGSC